MTPTKLLWPLLLATHVLGGPSYEIDTIKIDQVNVTIPEQNNDQIIKNIFEDFHSTTTIPDTDQLIKNIFKDFHSTTTIPDTDQKIDDIFIETFKCQAYKLRICALEIANNKIDLALNSFKKLQDSDGYNTLQKIINQTYAIDTKNLPQLLRFINRLSPYKHRYAGFEILSRIVNWKTPESFQFAYQVKKLLDEPQNYEDPELKEKLRFFKYIIPDGIRAIIWQKSKLCLKNVYNKEYLYSGACCKYDGDRRRAFTWIPQGEIGPQGEFTFEPVKEAALFWIKSDYFQERLYAADCCQYDGERRNVFTWIPKGAIGTQGEWTLELVNGTNVFRIRNNHYDEYLYAAECCYYDKERRSVFTWIPKGDIGIQGEWEISPC